MTTTQNSIRFRDHVVSGKQVSKYTDLESAVEIAKSYIEVGNKLVYVLGPFRGDKYQVVVAGRKLIKNSTFGRTVSFGGNVKHPQFNQ